MAKKRGKGVKQVAARPVALYDRVAAILEETQGNVVRAVNTNMVQAYWLIGREIVQELQAGQERAEYGGKLIEDLSVQLAKRYGQGFSATTLQYFRRFYLAYPERGTMIPRPLGVESGAAAPDHRPPRALGVESGLGADSDRRIYPVGEELTAPRNAAQVGIELPLGFSPHLSWSHYRALMRVEDAAAREFYEREAIAGGWDKRTLERQIHSYYYERLIKSRKPEAMLADGRRLPVTPTPMVELLKNPYVLEFLGLPNLAALHESDLERAIITHLQRFLLELGSGFAFVGRQQRLQIGAAERYIDLVFYHCREKFYLLIDLKVGELTHEDVGQMDGYVRLYDDLKVAPDDNPTIGLILCTERNATVAYYSVLQDRKQIFASKYMLFLPTEEQLSLAIAQERRQIEEAHGEYRYEQYPTS